MFNFHVEQWIKINFEILCFKFIGFFPGSISWIF